MTSSPITRLVESNHAPLIFVIVAAMLFSISTPVSKLILADAGPLTICALMYAGTITGMGVFALIRNRHIGKYDTTEAPLVLRNLPALTASSIFGSILAPAMLLVSLQYILAPEASLLTSFVAVTNTVIAVLFFREAVSSRIWIAISLITIGCMNSHSPLISGYI
ncbi:DMT family transporter [uncultured Methanospirillum sp.]|uniref:DMT family transporter n=1 Tax=uncultured Methanospirillum sp. TaxID=262503 RepID=UPI0029C80237|nr:DMT family transporter [uncultured Methanospirillum sp.]